MQTPKRKPGKYSHVKTDPHITESKYQALKVLVKKLKEDRKISSKEVARLAEFGDFSENHAYQMEKGRLRGINQRIKDTEDLLGSAIIIERKKSPSVVEIGSIVTIESGRQQQRYQILGSTETDPFKGIISHQSPIGSALLGHCVGDTIALQQGNETIEYTILNIE